MRFTRVAYTLALMSLSALTYAHTHLVKAVPAEGSTVNAAPSKFVLTFNEAARLTALSIQKGTEPAKKLGPLPEVAAAEVSIAAPPLTAGKYVLTWRAVGDDGHVVPGKLTFTVGP